MNVMNKLAAIFGLTTLCLCTMDARACETSEQAEPCPTLELEAGYIGDSWNAARGGLRSGTTYLDKLDLLASFNAERLLRVSGLSIHAHLQYNNGREFSGRYLGDAQVASNIEGVRSWRIYELWTEMNFGAAQHHSVKLGLYDLNSEFDVIEPAGLFLNSSHGIGAEIAQTGLNGPSIFPVTSLALRLRGERSKAYWQVALIDAVPGRPDDPTRTGFTVGSGEGALVVGEIGVSGDSFGHAALGAWRYSSAFDRINAFDVDGVALRAKGNQGVYASVFRSLYENGPTLVSAWLRAGVAASQFNQFAAYSGGGITISGLFAARRDDQFGIAIASAHTGSEWRALQRDAGDTPAARETNIELTWRAPVTDWLTLQPDLQYVLKPGANASVTDALALGLRFEFSLTKAY